MFGDAVEVDSHAGAYQPPLTTTTQRPQPPPALHSQAQVPHEAAKHAAAAAPDLVSRFTAREPLYRQMVLGSRDVGGLIRGGAQPSSTASTPQRAYNKASPTRRFLTRTDARIATTVERGLNERLYLIAVETGLSQSCCKWLNQHVDTSRGGPAPWTA
jgi:hypothetical protein